MGRVGRCMAGLTIRVGAFSLVQVDSINAAADTASVLLHSLLRISEMLLIVVDHVDILGFVVEIKTANAGQKRGGITQTSYTHVSLDATTLRSHSEAGRSVPWPLICLASVGKWRIHTMSLPGLGLFAALPLWPFFIRLAKYASRFSVGMSLGSATCGGEERADAAGPVGEKEEPSREVLLRSGVLVAAEGLLRSWNLRQSGHVACSTYERENNIP